MNIHIKDKGLFEALKGATLAKVEVGSSIYGLSDAESDKDYLYIYATPLAMLNSFLNTQHQLQYKEEGIDHNFVSLHTFLNNLINGDSTINFEVVNSSQLYSTPLSFLYDMRIEFSNYSQCRAYCGLARRDVKYYSKENTLRGRIKKVLHIWRGYYFTKGIMDGDFNLFIPELIDMANYLRNNPDENILNDYRYKGRDYISDIRELLNKKNDAGTLGLPKFLKVESMAKLDNHINTLMESNDWINKTAYLDGFDMGIFYNSFENWVEYD